MLEHVDDVSDPGVLDTHEGEGIELPRGLALNSVRLVCPGRHAMTRICQAAPE